MTPLWACAIHLPSRLPAPLPPLSPFRGIHHLSTSAGDQLSDRLEPWIRGWADRICRQLGEATPVRRLFAPELKGEPLV